MKELIKKVPIPLCGLMLGTAALGNLLQSYSEIAKKCMWSFSGILTCFGITETAYVSGYDG